MIILWENLSQLWYTVVLLWCDFRVINIWKQRHFDFVLNLEIHFDSSLLSRIIVSYWSRSWTSMPTFKSSQYSGSVRFDSEVSILNSSFGSQFCVTQIRDREDLVDRKLTAKLQVNAEISFPSVDFHRFSSVSKVWLSQINPDGAPYNSMMQ